MRLDRCWTWSEPKRLADWKKRDGVTDGTEPAQTRITIWGSTIELRPPINRKLLLCNLLVTEWCSLYEIVISSDFPLYHQKTGTKTGTSVSSDWRDSTKAPLMQQANSKHPAGGASRPHAINSSIMDLGLENFWTKEGLMKGTVFLA